MFVSSVLVLSGHITRPICSEEAGLGPASSKVEIKKAERRAEHSPDPRIERH